MAANYLEQLIAEWYEYQGFFVRRDVLVGKLPRGGHECELDVVAFHPHEQRLVHIEPSMDADSWAERERRYQKKFAAGRKYIPQLFKGLKLPDEIEQIAVLVFASTANHETLGGGRIVLITHLLEQIFTELKDRSIASRAVPEHLRGAGKGRGGRLGCQTSLPPVQERWGGNSGRSVMEGKAVCEQPPKSGNYAET